MNNIRQKIFEIIETSEESGKASRAYDIFMMVVIVVSLIPLTIKENSFFTILLDKTTVAIFIIDYILRLITADLLYPDKGRVESRVYFIFSAEGLIDLLALLPYFILMLPD